MSGLLTVEQEGRFQRYRANIPLMLELIAYLTEECCAVIRNNALLSAFGFALHRSGTSAYCQ